MYNSPGTQQGPTSAEPSSSSIPDSLSDEYGFRDEPDVPARSSPWESIRDGSLAAVDGADPERLEYLVGATWTWSASSDWSAAWGWAVQVTGRLLMAVQLWVEADELGCAVFQFTLLGGGSVCWERPQGRGLEIRSCTFWQAYG
jgi:hypothetical protein